MNKKFVVVDLETTGNSPKKGDKIIQFAAVVIENGKMIKRYNSFVNPQQKIPAFIEELTGLTDDMVKDAPVFSEIASEVIKLLDDAHFVAHNVLFDLSFLQEELLSLGYEGFYGPILDTVEMSRILYPTADSYKLSDLAFQEGIHHDRPHQADSDAFVTAKLFLRMLAKFDTIPTKTLIQLSKRSEGLKSDIHLILEDLILEKERTIEELPQQLETYRGLVFRKRADHDAVDDKQVVSIDDYSQADKEQLLKHAVIGYEKREGQFVMMDTVYEAFKHEYHALIEAGTGVGKSLAYLLPSVFFAKQSKKPVVISTYTTQLQHQLMAKDIPTLRKMLPFKLRTCLLKGRKHYLSLAKFEKSLHVEDENYDTSLTKMQILVWLTETKTGDRDELNLSSGGLLYWSKVNNDFSEFFHGTNWLDYDFYQNAKESAYKADIVITNHSVLLSDLVSDNRILPEFDSVVIDEGHHFAKASGKYFGFALDYMNSRLMMSQLGLYEQKQLFYRFETIVEKCTNKDSLIHTFELNSLLSDLFYEIDQFYKIVTVFIRKKHHNRSSSQTKLSYRIRQNEDGRIWTGLVSEAERLSFLLRDIIESLTKRMKRIKTEKLIISDDERIFLEEFAIILDKLTEMRKIIIQIFLSPLDNYVRWIETDLRSVQNSTTIYAHPVNVAEFLQNQFFSIKKSVVVTSAALTVKNSFHYTMKELGINQDRCIQRVIPSPFQYNQQVRLFIPNDLPEINTVSQDDYSVAISEQIISIAEATNGRMLVLFTSHEMLRKTYNLMKESNFLDDFVVMAQGITSGSRTRLTRNFQRFEKAILLGTNSFWEGIDIPGEDLSCLIIVRLPFSPPDEPITEAKCNQIKQQGGNPFSQYSLPEAVIRFKQGFGRLIRKSTDKGVIIVLDRRIVTTQYGKAFLQSIPKISVEKFATKKMVQNIKKWLYN